MRKNKGFTLIELMIVIAIIGILALIAIPNFVQLRVRAYNASAQSSGYNCKVAQELYYQNSHSGAGGGYSGALSDLLVWDKNLTDDPEVTFSFTANNQSGYTFSTKHSRGDTWYPFND
jgi:prepilin-type N-terminal cleavage/methylation domain-containing protein